MLRVDLCFISSVEGEPCRCTVVESGVLDTEHQTVLLANEKGQLANERSVMCR